ncbi:hypothetical protein [Scytonema sp. NUACC21]
MANHSRSSIAFSRLQRILVNAIAIDKLSLRAKPPQLSCGCFTLIARRFISTEFRISRTRIRGLDDLLAEGCNLLQDYFVMHPKALEEL